MKEENEPNQTVDSPAHAEAMQLMELIRFLARTLGFNNAKLSRRAKVPLATLVRYFKGEGEPKLEFLLSMVRTLGLDIREFFDLAYPAPTAPSPARLKLERILRQIQPSRLEIAQPPKQEASSSSSSVSREDVEKMMADLRRDLREIVTGSGEPAPAATSKPAAPAAKRRKKSGEA